MTCTTPYGKGVVLAGTLSNMYTAVLNQGDCKVGIWLKPGTRFLFSHCEPSQLRNKVIIGRSMSRTIQELEIMVERLPTPQEKLACMQDFVELLINRGELIQHTIVNDFVSAARASNGQATVQEIMQNLPIGYRQGTRLIKQHTGFTPKEFLKLQRFSTAAHALDASLQPIAAIAADHNYADHPHFTREFRARTGLTPSKFGDYQAL